MLKAYLAGPVENKENMGKDWREKITPRLLGLGIKALDPTQGLDAKGDSEWERREREREVAKQTKDWETLTEIMHRIWVMNKGGVDEADFLIVHCRDSDNMSGTIREMQDAYEYGKPIFLVVDGDASKVRAHTLYMALQRGQVFSSFDELFAYLKELVKDKKQELKAHQPDLYQVSQKLLIVNPDNQLLILKDAHAPYYDFPGGRINIVEFAISLPDSLKREVLEELGPQVRLKIDDRPLMVERDLLWDRLLGQPHYRRIFLLYYQAQYLGGEIKLSDEHEFYKWVDRQTFELTNEPFKPSDQRVVEEFLRQKRGVF